MPETKAETVELVCPNCGSDRIGTQERAVIWQRASFTLDDEHGFVETAEGKAVDIEWEAYDSEDVGDTESCGYFCAECIGTWETDDGKGLPSVPFVPRGTPPIHEWPAY